MVPSAFVVMEALPRLPNGKVDRMALPAPEQSRSELEEGYVAPRTPAEEILAGIWREVLKLHKVGVHDNFFELGGHSLLATQVISRIRKAFQIEIPLRALFEKPTVEELTLAIVERQTKDVREEEAATILAELESLSEEQIEQHLIERNN
jgi:acyl carrier protein